MKRWPLLALLLSSPVWAQGVGSVLQQSVTGDEIMNAQTTGGQGIQIPLNVVRNTVNRVITATGTYSLVPHDQTVILATAAAVTINLPNPAPDGDVIILANPLAATSGTITVQTLSTPQTGQTIVGAAPATIPATSSIQWSYVWSQPGVSGNTGVWYRSR